MHKFLLVLQDIGTNENIRMLTVVLTTIKRLETTQDQDHCQYHLGIDHCHTRNRCQDREYCQNGNEHADDQDQWSALKYKLMHQFNHIMIITC